jgi:hypothetical protein
MAKSKRSATSATTRHAGRVGQRRRTAGQGSGRTTGSSRARTSESIRVEGVQDRLKLVMNPRTGAYNARVMRDY